MDVVSWIHNFVFVHCNLAKIKAGYIERGGLMVFHQGASDHILWEGYAFFFHIHSLLHKCECIFQKQESGSLKLNVSRF
jgi:hypothetical protein